MIATKNLVAITLLFNLFTQLMKQITTPPATRRTSLRSLATIPMLCLKKGSKYCIDKGVIKKRQSIAMKSKDQGMFSVCASLAAEISLLDGSWPAIMRCRSVINFFCWMACCSSVATSAASCMIFFLFSCSMYAGCDHWAKMVVANARPQATKMLNITMPKAMSLA